MATSAAGILFVWADVDPAFEDDYNRWYDREHVEERARIPGFTGGARYRVAGPGRRYLGLYPTTSLAVFDSPAYRAAFAHQTPWSVTNLGRMRDAMRRVCAVTCETGAGTGSWLAVLRLGRMPDAGELAVLQSLGASLQDIDGVIATRLLVPDEAKSTPLPNETPGPRVFDPILLIDGTSEAQVRAAADTARRSLGEAGRGMEIAILSLMWHMRSADLAEPRAAAE